jgi:hypothetical protein
MLRVIKRSPRPPDHNPESYLLWRPVARSPQGYACISTPLAWPKSWSATVDSDRRLRCSLALQRSLVGLCPGLTPLIAPAAQAQVVDKSTWPVVVNPLDPDDPDIATALACRDAGTTLDDDAVLSHGRRRQSAGRRCWAVRHRWSTAARAGAAPVSRSAGTGSGPCAGSRAAHGHTTALQCPSDRGAPNLDSSSDMDARGESRAHTQDSPSGLAAVLGPACTAPMLGSPSCQWINSRRHLLTDLVVSDQSGRPLTLRAGDDVQLGPAVLDSYGQPWVRLTAASLGGWGALYLLTDTVRALDRGA